MAQIKVEDQRHRTRFGDAEFSLDHDSRGAAVFYFQFDRSADAEIDIICHRRNIDEQADIMVVTIVEWHIDEQVGCFRALQLEQVDRARYIEAVTADLVFGVMDLDLGKAQHHGNQVVGNYIGTNRQGTAAIPNDNHGIFIQDEAQSNTVGGTSSGFRNVISGNTQWGISIKAANTDSNTVSANYIGLNASGGAVLSNGSGDVQIYDGAQSNVVGGDTSGERNVISGEGPGVSIGGTGTSFNTVSGNYIGPNATGASLSTFNAGVYISGAASSNTIGGDSAGEGNLISGQGIGVVLEHAGTNSNTISGNLIGTDAAEI